MAEARAWRSRVPAGPLSAFGIIIIAATVAIDQLSKLAALAWLPLGQAINLLPILTLYRVENTGIAFSFLSGSGFPLVALTVGISVGVVALWIRSTEGGWPVALGFALILGGAIGNLIDRLRLGSVVDFLLLHLGERTLFVFNLADAALTLGPILLVAVYLGPSKT